MCIHVYTCAYSSDTHAVLHVVVVDFLPVVCLQLYMRESKNEKECEKMFVSNSSRKRTLKMMLTAFIVKHFVS